jgi:hypothetical protein
VFGNNILAESSGKEDDGGGGVSESLLGALSPANAFGEGDFLLALRAYFDGAHCEGRVMTLTCLAANDQTWGEVESVWVKAKHDHGNPAYIHMTDLMACKGIYQGWLDTDRDGLLNALIEAISPFKNHNWLRSFSTWIDIPAWERYRNENNHPAPARLCSRLVFPQMVDWFYSPNTGIFVNVIDAFFDSGEPFMHHIRADWNSNHIRRMCPVWNLVRTVEPADSKLAPALQMADMVCWGFHHQRTYHHPRPWEVDHDGYTWAVQCANAVTGIYTPITEEALQLGRFREEGQALIELWKKKGTMMMNSSDEFRRFHNMMKRLIHAPHEKVKSKLDAEKQA